MKRIVACVRLSSNGSRSLRSISALSSRTKSGRTVSSASCNLGRVSKSLGCSIRSKSPSILWSLALSWVLQTSCMMVSYW